jgi:hypothetical protein
MTSPVVRVLYAALLSRLLVLLVAVLADLHVTDYDTSGRYDVPNTSTRCQLSDGDEKTPQARGRSSTVLLSAVSAEQPPHLRVAPSERPAAALLLPRSAGASRSCHGARTDTSPPCVCYSLECRPHCARTSLPGTRFTMSASRSAATRRRSRTRSSLSSRRSCAACKGQARSALRHRLVLVPSL